MVSRQFARHWGHDGEHDGCSPVSELQLRGDTEMNGESECNCKSYGFGKHRTVWEGLVKSDSQL